MVRHSSTVRVGTHAPTRVTVRVVLMWLRVSPHAVRRNNGSFACSKSDVINFFAVFLPAQLLQNEIGYHRHVAGAWERWERLELQQVVELQV